MKAKLTRLRAEMAGLQSERLSLLFGALFDDQQRSNAADALVAHCRREGWHPTDIVLLVGGERGTDYSLYRYMQDLWQQANAEIAEVRKEKWEIAKRWRRLRDKFRKFRTVSRQLAQMTKETEEDRQIW